MRRRVATTVLVIDVEAPIRLLCRVNLEAEGMTVLEAADGPSGLEKARSETPDVVLLDVMMPGLDGWRVAEELLEDRRTAHVGISLRPSFRGRGLAIDVLHVLCRYGFDTRGLHRLQLETLADNVPMIRAAERAGFALEGTLRRSAWAGGEFADEVILARLAG
jgi:CheY-like chemotaxis protein